MCYHLTVVECHGKWEPIPQGVTCHVVSLNSKTTEYGEVKKKFEETMKLQTQQQQSLSNSLSVPSGYKTFKEIVKIERIQNPFLYAQYVAKKRIMDRHNPPSITNERELFHGCPGDVAKKISHQGFNRSFAGLANGLFLYIMQSFYKLMHRSICS